VLDRVCRHKESAREATASGWRRQPGELALQSLEQVDQEFRLVECPLHKIGGAWRPWLANSAGAVGQGIWLLLARLPMDKKKNENHEKKTRRLNCRRTIGQSLDENAGQFSTPGHHVVGPDGCRRRMHFLRQQRGDRLGPTPPPLPRPASGDGPRPAPTV